MNVEHGPQDPNPYTSIHLLRAASHLDIVPIKQIALRELEKCEQLDLISPAMKLSLAVELRILPWIRPAVISLLKNPHLPVVEADIVDLGPHLLHDLLVWRDKIDALRLATVADYIFDVLDLPACPRPMECYKSIITCWRGIRTNKYLSFGRYNGELLIRLESAEVCEDCCTEVLTHFQGKRILLAEDDLVKEAADWMYCKWHIEAGSFEL